MGSYNKIGSDYLPKETPRPTRYRAITASETLTPADNGSIIAIGTDALVVTLPAVGTGSGQAPAGTTFTFLNIGSAGNNIITISPNASDKIQGNLSKSAGSNADATTADGLVSISGAVDDKDWINTKATANTGDRCTLVSDGSIGWWIIDGVGIWASEA